MVITKLNKALNETTADTNLHRVLHYQTSKAQ
jgi:hypothetical protein